MSVAELQRVAYIPLQESMQKRYPSVMSKQSMLGDAWHAGVPKEDVRKLRLDQPALAR